MRKGFPSGKNVLPKLLLLKTLAAAAPADMPHTVTVLNKQRKPGTKPGTGWACPEGGTPLR
jgi:hypothetical protein